MRKGIIDVHPYNGTEELLLLGNLSALAGIYLALSYILNINISTV